MEDIAIYGGGGFAKEVYCLINAINKQKPQWNVVGYFDDLQPKGAVSSIGTNLGGIDDLNSYSSPLSIVFAIGNPIVIKKIVNQINNTIINFPNIIAPDVIFLDIESLKIGKGNVIMFQSLVSYDVCIEDFNILNCGVSLGHEVSLGSFNSLMSYVKVSGNVGIEHENYFGVCSVVLQNLKIGTNTTIGTNSVIMRKTKNNSTYLGNPAVEILKPSVK